LADKVENLSMSEANQNLFSVFRGFTPLKIFIVGSILMCMVVFLLVFILDYSRKKNNKNRTFNNVDLSKTSNNANLSENNMKTNIFSKANTFDVKKSEMGNPQVSVMNNSGADNR
jgi:hypothetical protein